MIPGLIRSQLSILCVKVYKKYKNKSIGALIWAHVQSLSSTPELKSVPQFRFGEEYRLQMGRVKSGSEHCVFGPKSIWQVIDPEQDPDCR